MTDVLTQDPPAPAAAPAPTPAPSVPAEPPKTDTPAGPMGKREAREAMRQDLSDRREQFEKALATEETTEGETKPEETKPPEGTPKAPEGEPKPAEGEPAPADGEKKPEEPKPGELKLMKVEIDPSHPLYGMNGVKTLGAWTPEEERVVRALLNGYTRTRDSDVVRAENRELKRENLKLKTDTASAEKWKQTEQHKKSVARFKQIRDDVGPEVADEYWNGVMGEYKTFTEAEFKAELDKLDASEQEEAAAKAIGEAWQRAQRLPEPIRSLQGFRTWFDSAIKAFEAELGIEGSQISQEVTDVPSMHKAFDKFFGTRLIQQPGVREALKKLEEQKAIKDAPKPPAAPPATGISDAEKKRIADEAVEAFKAQQAGRRPNPLVNPSNPPRDRAAAPPTTPTPADRSAPSPAAGQEETADQLRRRQRLEARGDARRHFPV